MCMVAVGKFLISSHRRGYPTYSVWKSTPMHTISQFERICEIEMVVFFIWQHIMKLICLCTFIVGFAEQKRCLRNDPTCFLRQIVAFKSLQERCHCHCVCLLKTVSQHSVYCACSYTFVCREYSFPSLFQYFINKSYTLYSKQVLIVMQNMLID